MVKPTGQSRVSRRNSTKAPIRKAAQGRSTAALLRGARRQVLGQRKVAGKFNQGIPAVRAVSPDTVDERHFRVTNTGTKKVLEIIATSWQQAVQEALANRLAKSVDKFRIEVAEKINGVWTWTDVTPKNISESYELAWKE